MAAGNEVNTVWIGFMDIVPVIGTVKEAVELVLALYEGNEAVVEEKEKVMEDFFKESFKKHVKEMSRGDEAAIKEKENIAEDNLKESFKKHVKVRESEVDYSRPNGSRDGAAATSEYSGLKNVKEIRKEMIIEYMSKGSQKGAKGTPAETEKKENERKVEAIKKVMLEKIRVISPAFKFSQGLKEQLQRSKKGEHVFNNNILKFHSKVLKDFILRRGIDDKGYNELKKDKLDSHTLDEDTEDKIQKKMVVDFDDDEFYLNVNSEIYGECCRVLREALLAVLNHKNPGHVTDKEKERVDIVIDKMNKHEFYVDQPAKVKWINKDKTGKLSKQDKKDIEDRQTQFDNVKRNVADMYRTGRGLEWCYDIQRKVASKPVVY